VTNYLFIESRDPFESTDTRFVAETAAALQQRDAEVTVFLVQNGVLAARRNARASQVQALAKAGVKLLADDFSLRERGIQPAELIPGIQSSGVEAIVDALIRPNTRVLWH